MADNNRRPFLQPDTAMQAFEETRKWYRPYHEPIDELNRIARNKPSPMIDPSLPKVTEGTTAAYVQEKPKAIVQQLTTGIVECKDHPEYAKIADIVHRDDLVPMYNRGGNKLQKSWQMIGKALTVGKATSYTFLTTTGGKIHTDFVIPYEKDSFGEKGKPYSPDSNYRFLRAWYQKTDLQAILRREKFMKETKGKDYVQEWDPALLSQFIEEGATSKTAEQMTPAEREKGDGNSGGYEIIHAFQVGKGAEGYSFSPRFQNGKNLRVKVSKDPRGKMPLNDLYCNIDGSNPMGRGQVELSGGVQNLQDQQMQMFMFQSTMEMGAPLKVWGNVNKASLKYRPNSIWDMGGLKTTGNDVEPYQGSTWALQNYVSNAQFLQAKMQQLNPMNDNSISADSGNVGQSKTHAGVKANDNRIGINDTYLRKQFETWDGEQSETSINIYFAEMTTPVTKRLEGDDLDDIKKSPAAKFLQGDILTIPFKEITDVALKFTVDPSSSEIKEDADNVEKLQHTYELMKDDTDPEVQREKKKVLKVLIKEIGAEGTEDIFPEQEVDAQGNVINNEQGAAGAINPEMVQQMVQEAIQAALQEIKQANEKPLIEQIGLKFADLPDGARQTLIQQLLNIDPIGETDKDKELELKAHEITIKSDALEADTVLKAEKQASDEELAIQNYLHSEDESQFSHAQAERSQTFTEKQAEVQNKQAAQEKKTPAGAAK